MGTGRLVAALAGAMVMTLLLAACGGIEIDGQATTSTPTERTAVDPQPCLDADCPALPVGEDMAVDDAGVDPGDPASVTAYLDAVLDDLDRRWDGWAADLDWGTMTAGRVLVEPGQTFTTECVDNENQQLVVEADTPNAFYCGIDTAPDGNDLERLGSVVLPVLTFADIWDGRLLGDRSNFLGDFSAAIIVAHEYGHNVVNRAARQWDTAQPPGENNELIADCLAGTWAATVFERSDLSASDIVQAVVLMSKVADPEPGLGHGTQAQRIAALTRGFAGRFQGQGHPVSCFQSYWPQLIEVQRAGR